MDGMAKRRNATKPNLPALISRGGAFWIWVGALQRQEPSMRERLEEELMGNEGQGYRGDGGRGTRGESRSGVGVCATSR